MKIRKKYNDKPVGGIKLIKDLCIKSCADC